MVYRVFVEKKERFADRAEGIGRDIRNLLGIEKLHGIRIINRYDVDNIDEGLFEECIWKVFAEPQADNAAAQLEDLPFQNVAREDVISLAAAVFAVETIPGCFDRRADSAEQCIQMLSQGERPTVRCAVIYVLYGDLSPMDIGAVKSYLIDPADSREASFALPESLGMSGEEPAQPAILTGFTTMTERTLPGCIEKMGLEMDEADLAMCVDYFRDEEERDPTITELRLIDRCWSESCRHTAFNTIIDSVVFEDRLLEKAYRDYLAVRKAIRRDKPVTLKDIATMAVRELKLMGRLDKLDESGECDACTIKINVEVDGENEPWLLLFKSGADNNSAETDPAGGAASCLGGCISEPLSGRAYVYSAMRVAGSADPLQPLSAALPGRLPQRTISTGAATGSSGYGNEAGICTGIADEIYHPGYAAGRLETGAVMAAAPAVNVRRERPEPGDAVMLLGGPSDTASEMRKIQRLFRKSTVTRMIKRCSGLGAGGIGVAIAGLAKGVDINLDAVYGISGRRDGTELVLREVPERMACVINAENEDLFKVLASDENLRCVRVATVTEEPRLVIRWNMRKIADISTDFLRSRGADKHIDIATTVPGNWRGTSMFREVRSFTAAMHDMAQNLNVCSKRGMTERFDSSAGAGSVLMPFGGRYQITPAQAVVHKIPLEKGSTDDCSMMAYGFNPYISSESPYHGAYLAVVESIARLIASGSSFKDIYLSFREYFGAPGREAERWGKPFAAALGAFEAQTGLGVGAVGCDGSMCEPAGELDVPPTLISFAFTMGKAAEIMSPEFKKADHKVIVLKPELEADDTGVGRWLPKPESLIRVWQTAYDLISSGEAVAACTPGTGGIAEAVMKMCLGNGIGFRYEPEVLNAGPEGSAGNISSGRKTAVMKDIFGYNYGSIILEIDDGVLLSGLGVDIETLGVTTSELTISLGDESLKLGALISLYEGRLESVFPTRVADNRKGLVENVNYQARSWHTPIFKRAEPRVLIPVFAGTSCEYESARAVREAGAQAEIMMINNRSSDDVKYSVERFARALKDTQIVFLPGGCAAGCEPDGSAKIITAFFRNAAVAEGISELLDRQDGLMCGICEGFQAMIKLGLVPYGRIMDLDEESPTLTYNMIGSARSRIARVRIASNKSPWLRYNKVGEVCNVPVAHGEGRFVATDDMIRHLAGTGQIATQYADMKGKATADIRYNPSGSIMAVEGITSPDGRVIGRMGHPERAGSGLYRNVEGNYFMGMFENAVKYFK